MLRRTVLLLLVPALALTCAADASAHWSALGTGSSSGTVGTLSAPTGVAASATPNSGIVPVSWTASAGTPSPQGYYVIRTRTSDSAQAPACGSSATALVAGTGCNDTAVPNGSYTYAVVAKYRTWTAQSASSNAVTVTIDTTPTSTITFPAAGGSYRSTTWTAGCNVSPFNVTGRICGTAQDRSGSGLQNVQVSIRRGTGNYWNGTSFGNASEQKFPTTTLAGGNWTLTFAAANLSPDGAYTVRVYATDNQAQTQASTTSSTFTIDNAAPTNALSLTSASPAGSSLLLGPSNIVFYRGVVAGSFKLRNAVGDAGSGPASSTTGALGGTTTGWSHSAGAITTPAGGPYDSSSFSWAAGTTSAPTEVVSGADVAGNVTAAPALTFKNDSTAPTGGALTVNGTAASVAGTSSYDPDGTFTIGTHTSYAETQSATASGLASSTLEREEATLASNSCGGYGAPVTIVATPAQNAAAGISAAHCYRYRLTGIDNVGNTVSVETTVKVDTSAPATPTLSFSGLSANAFYGSTLNTLYFRPVAGGAYTVTAASSDPQSDIMSANAGYTFNGLGATFTRTQSAGQASYTFGTAASQPGANPTVLATNNAGLDSPTTSYALKSDSTAPTAGALTVNGTVATNAGTTSVDTDGDFTIGTRTDYAEAQTATASGLASSELTVETATLSGTTCGSFGPASGISGSPAQTDMADGCYRYTLTGTDRVTNAASVTTTVKVDANAPTLVSLEMLDTDGDGKVNQVKATFSETLAAYTAGNTPWTLTNVPSGGVLHVAGAGGVAVSGAVATLTIDEGAGAADTAVGSFQIQLAASATGIRDASGNRSAFTATSPTDKAAPLAIALADTNGATDGRFELNDTMTVTFTEAIAGVGATTNVQLVGGNGSSNDTLSLSGVSSAASLGRTDYITGNGITASFNGSALSQPAATQLRVTLAACSGTCANLGTGAGLGNYVFSPVAGITDLAGNAAAGGTFSVRLF